MTTIATEETSERSGVSSRPCSKCGIGERSRKNSSWCKSCINEQAALYRQGRRREVRTEERTCPWEECGQTFTWRSTHPRQVCCSAACFRRWDWRRKHPRPVIELLPEGQQECYTCGKVKGVTDFSPSQFHIPGHRRGRCRECSRAYEKRRRQDPEVRARASAATRRSQTSRKLRNWGAPSDQYPVVLAAQGGACMICGAAESVKAFHVDHDHALPEEISFRGLLCSGCNIGLGAFCDDPARIERAAEYLIVARLSRVMVS